MLFLQMPYELFQTSIYFLTQSRGYKHSILKQIPQAIKSPAPPHPSCPSSACPIHSIGFGHVLSKAHCCNGECPPHSCCPPTKKVVASMWSKRRGRGSSTAVPWVPSHFLSPYSWAAHVHTAVALYTCTSCRFHFPFFPNRRF